MEVGVGGWGGGKLNEPKGFIRRGTQGQIVERFTNVSGWKSIRV